VPGVGTVADMDLTLTDEEREIRDWVRTFVTRELMPLEPQVLERERQGERGFTLAELRELQEKAKQSGFFGVLTPEEYGGMGLGSLMAALIEIELGRTFVQFKFGGDADNILFHANDEQKKRYLEPTISGERYSCFAITEPGAGSDARNIRTSAVRDGDEWVINGEKTFITGGDIADFTMVFAVTDKEKGADGGVTCFLVDREAGWTSASIPTMGQWGPASLSFEDVRVPHSAILGEEGRGFALAMKWIGKGRFMLPARALGACERLVEMAMEQARNRVTFGEPIANRQAIQWMIADSAVEIEALRWLVLTAAWQVDNGIDSRQAQSMAKLYGGVQANQIVDRVLQIHGGMGYTRELPIERWYRELRLLRIYEGTDEIQRRTIARNLLKGHVRLGGIGE
jgi:acyl-CoA dehydrogenase